MVYCSSESVKNGLSMVDYLYLDVFIEVKGRFSVFYRNVELKIASFISAQLCWLYTVYCICTAHALYQLQQCNTTPLVMLMGAQNTIIGYAICDSMHKRGGVGMPTTVLTSIHTIKRHFRLQILSLYVRTVKPLQLQHTVQWGYTVTGIFSLGI